jgi:hypothetical protein
MLLRNILIFNELVKIDGKFFSISFLIFVLTLTFLYDQYWHINIIITGSYVHQVNIVPHCKESAIPHSPAQCPCALTDQVHLA